MQLNETLYCLAEEGDVQANFVLKLTKGHKNPVYWFNPDEDINYGEFYLKTDDVEYGDLD